jgi:hypothetical protein
LPGWPEPVTTDAQGRFVLRGVPQGLGAGLRVRDPRFALQIVDLPAPEKGKGDEVTRVLAPVRVVEGTVTDSASGKPVANARVRVSDPGSGALLALDVSASMHAGDVRGRRGVSHLDTLAFVARAELGLDLDADELPPLEVRTDAKGRFRMNLFRASFYTLRVTTPGAPYLPRTVRVSWPQQAVVRQQVNVALVRGVPVRGRVTEAPGGKAVAGARVDFWSKGLKLPQGVRHPRAVKTDADGAFRALLPPGAWHLLVNGPQPVYRVQPLAVEKVQEDGPRPQVVQFDKAGKLRPGVAETPGQYYPDAWVPLELKPRAAAREVAVTLKRAPLLRGRVVGPDGKPLKGVLSLRRPASPLEGVAYLDSVSKVRLWDADGRLRLGTMRVFRDGQDTGGRGDAFYRVDNVVRLSQAGERLGPGQFTDPVELPDGTFSIPVLDPRMTFPILFFDARRGLGAFVELKGEQAGKEPLMVRLSKCGSARARFVDAKGNALAGYRPSLWLLVPPGPHPVPAKAAEVVKGGMRLGDALWVAVLDPVRYGAGPSTDAQGRVTLSGLIPRATYRLLLADGKARDFSVGADQGLDLADVTVVERAQTGKLPTVQPPKAP